MDAGLKGITGDLFGARAAPPAPVRHSPAPAAAPTPRTANSTPAAIARTPRSTAVARKLPAFYYRLPLQAQRRYLASDAIDRFHC